jgi:8-oxo-dGTP diphosphatase
VELVTFAVTVDLAVFTIRDDRLCALAVRRGVSPYRGRLALPGGFVLENEGLLEAARRELAEETGLDDRRMHLEQLATYGAPRRDPRMRVVSVAYLAFAAELPEPSAGTDAAEASWRPVAELLTGPGRLAFDHGQILTDGLERARAKLEYSPLATVFCRSEFTVAELRHVYEVVWGAALDPRNFHRKVTGSPRFLVPTGKRTTRNGGRPAQLYRRGKASLLNPPITR